MRESNFIAFWVVSGFFLGLMVAFVGADDPAQMLSAVVSVTLFFYLLAHVSVALFVRFMEFGKVHFEKEEYDRKLDYFYNQLLQREKELDTNYEYISKDEISVQSTKKDGDR
ncbi:motility integral membrane protein [Hydrogenimonas sp.]|nr:motility integral membrane protein [Hydrogenimonas sp.]